MRTRTLIIALSAAVLAAGIAGWMIGRSTGGPSPIGGHLATDTPTTDTGYVLTAFITGSEAVLPYGSDLCYSEQALGVSFEVRDPSGVILAIADSVEPLGCNELMATFTVPRAGAYQIALETGGVWGFGSIGGTWGPFSFEFLDRSGWMLNLSDES